MSDVRFILSKLHEEVGELEKSIQCSAALLESYKRTIEEKDKEIARGDKVINDLRERLRIANGFAHIPGAPYTSDTPPLPRPNIQGNPPPAAPTMPQNQVPFRERIQDARHWVRDERFNAVRRALEQNFGGDIGKDIFDLLAPK